MGRRKPRRTLAYSHVAIFKPAQIGCGTFVADTMIMKAQAIVIAVGGVYIAILAAMFSHGWQTAAEYLAMPAWYMVASPLLALAGTVPGMMDLLGWQASSALLLVLSGVLNVFAAYWVARAVDRTRVR